MATVDDYALLRADTGTDDVSLDEASALYIYDQASTLYPEGADAVIYAAARVLVLRQKVATYAEQVTYTQNNESENLTDAFKAIKILLDYWERKLNDALEASTAPSSIFVPPSGSVRLRATF